MHCNTRVTGRNNLIDGGWLTDDDIITGEIISTFMKEC